MSCISRACRVVAFAQPAIPFRSGLVKMVEETGTWIVLQKRGLLIKTPCKHKYRVLNRSMADVLEVMGAWLALNGDDYFDQVAGAVMMLAGGSRRRRRRRRLRIAAALAVCTRRHRAPPEYIRLTRNKKKLYHCRGTLLPCFTRSNLLATSAPP